jgi:ABC-type polysaccharide/polyol phosphate export permease
VLRGPVAGSRDLDQDGVAMLRRLSDRTIGYALAALILVPLMIWARRSTDGLYALGIVVAIFMLIAFAIRWRTGRFPGD